MKRNFSLRLLGIVNIVLCLVGSFTLLAKGPNQNGTSIDKENSQSESVSEEIAEMQVIEPGFIPKDERALKIFSLEQELRAKSTAIKQHKEMALQMRATSINRFKNELNHYTQEKNPVLDEEDHKAMMDLIKYNEEALKNNPHDPNFAPDAMYNLGLYYYEVDEREYFNKLSLYEEAQKIGRNDILYPEENFSRTIDIYERLIKEFPSFKHLDSVYYLLALSFWYEGAFDLAVTYFQDLIKKFPKSRYVLEAWFRLGEYHYDMLQFDEAIKAYGEILKNKSSPLYDKAIYKTAWSYFQKDRYKEAILYFVKVFELTEKEEESSTRNEAIRYIVRSFSDEIFKDQDLLLDDGQELFKRIIAYLENNNKPAFTREVLLETASQLLLLGKNTGAILAFTHLLKMDPYHKDNPRIEAQIIEILQEANKEEEAQARNLMLIKRYKKQGDWYKAMSHNIEALRIAQEAVRDAMLSLAVYYHKAGRTYKEANNELLAEENFKRAASLYLLYIKEYPERDDIAKALFYFAESSFETKHFKRSLEAYQLLKDYPLPVPENIRRDATFNIVFTFRHVLEEEAKKGAFKNIDFDALSAKYAQDQEEQIPLLGQKYLQAIDEFLRIAPEDPQVPILLFHAAAIYYAYGHKEESKRRFFYIIDNYPKKAAAAVAARLILDDAVKNKDWPTVEKLSKRFKEQDLGGQKEEFAQMEGSARFKIARAIFEDANELIKKNQLALAKEKYRESLELFSMLLQDDPKNPYADIMLWNMARSSALAGSVTRALPLYKRLYREFPKSEYAKRARFQEALSLEKMLKFSEAARAYDGIIKLEPGSESAGDAMLNKALLYEAAGEDNNAILAFLAFAKEFPKRPEAPEALLLAASLYKKAGNINQQVATLERFIKEYSKDKSKAPAVIEAHVLIAESYGVLKQKTTSYSQKQRFIKLETEHYKKAIALYSPNLDSPLAGFFAAKSELFLDSAEQNSFKKMSINARTGKAQGEQLTAMMKKLSILQNKNEEIIKKYAQPVWNAKALYRIGELYEHLALSMLNAPCPRDVEVIDEYACDEYIVLLEEKALVLEEKSLDAYKKAYDIALNSYDVPVTMIDDIQKALNRLRPGKYRRVGNVIEKEKKGTLYGSGRMLSTGKIASGLHQNEPDPDITRPEEKPNESVPEEGDMDKKAQEKVLEAPHE